jgi:nucleotide-binding universal stress UspA family protein
MINVIVPIDFSETSLNAAHYAAKMFANKAEVNIILYHFYESEQEIITAKNYLNSLRTELLNACSSIEIIVESGNDFIDSLAAYAHIKRAYIIVMGFAGKPIFQHRFSDLNTLKISEKNVCPVLIIPSEATYQGVSNVLIASEMKYIDETPVILTIKRILKDFESNLHILNVNDTHYMDLTTEFKEARDRMEELLADFKPEFHFMRLFDFSESMKMFIEDKNIDLIIMGDKYHNFFEKLFKTQHTKKMLFQSKVPILLVHE